MRPNFASDPGWRTPGYPQRMQNVVRVLPPELYDLVMTGDREVEPDEVFDEDQIADPCCSSSLVDSLAGRAGRTRPRADLVRRPAVAWTTRLVASGAAALVRRLDRREDAVPQFDPGLQ